MLVWDVTCVGFVHVCACFDISACRVSAKSILVKVRKARCKIKWRFFVDCLTFRGRLCLLLSGVVGLACVIMIPNSRKVRAQMFMCKNISENKENIL